MELTENIGLRFAESAPLYYGNVKNNNVLAVDEPERERKNGDGLEEVQEIVDHFKKINAEKNLEHKSLSASVKDFQQALLAKEYADKSDKDQYENVGTHVKSKLELLRTALDRLTLQEKIDAHRESSAMEGLRSLIEKHADRNVSPQYADLLTAISDLDDFNLSEDPPASGETEAPAAFSAESKAAGSDTGQYVGDIWKQLANSIDNKNADLSDYAKALEKYTELYQGVTDVLTKLSNLVRSSGENNIEVDFKSLKDALQKVLNEPMIIAGTTPRGGLSRAAAEAMCEKLGLDPGACIQRNSYDYTYYIVPDKSQINTIIEQFNGRDDKHSMSVAAFQTWKAGFDSQISRIEEAMQTRGQKYSNAYSRFENYHKTISSIIQSMADMLKSYLQF